jgi:TRAP-type C4-dicarboxylate transport system permease large subunit
VGLVTPPVGVCLYIACDLMKLKIIPASKALLPFLVVTLICIGLMILFPQVILWPASWI